MWCGLVSLGVAWFSISCIFFSTIDCSIHAATSNTSAVLCTLYAGPSFPIPFQLQHLHSTPTLHNAEGSSNSTSQETIP